LKKILIGSLVASSLLLAAQDAKKDPDALVTHTEFGYMETQGNTATQTFNLDSKVKKGWGAHIAHFLFDGQYASNENEEIKNKYLIELEYDYEFNSDFAFAYLAGFKDDKFSGFKYQFYTGPGVKYKAIKTDNHKLNLEANILYSRDDIDEVRYDADGDVINYPNPDDKKTVTTDDEYTEDYASARAKLVYSWQILENLKFDQDLSYRCDLNSLSTYFVFSKTSFSAKLSDIFSAGISYKIDYTNEPAEGKERSDRTFTANLIIDY